jgi:hypothetical protein
MKHLFKSEGSYLLIDQIDEENITEINQELIDQNIRTIIVFDEEVYNPKVYSHFNDMFHIIPFFVDNNQFLSENKFINLFNILIYNKNICFVSKNYLNLLPSILVVIISTLQNLNPIGTVQTLRKELLFSNNNTKLINHHYLQFILQTNNNNLRKKIMKMRKRKEYLESTTLSRIVNII